MFHCSVQQVTLHTAERLHTGRFWTEVTSGSDISFTSGSHTEEHQETLSESKLKASFHRSTLIWCDSSSYDGNRKSGLNICHIFSVIIFYYGNFILFLCVFYSWTTL